MLTTRSKPEVVVTLPSDREIVFTCVFSHPAELLFEAWTDPEHIPHWQGCETANILSCEVDLRPGGAWSFVMRMPDGMDYPLKGVYREIVSNERLVYTSCFDVASVGRPEWLTTVTFETVQDGTKLTHRILHKTAEARDGHLQSGMERGSRESLARLDECAAHIAEKRA